MSVIVNIRLETDLSEFTSTVTDSGDLYWAAAAALAGTAGGMAMLLDDTTGIYGQVTIAALSAVDDFRARFYVDPNTLTMGASEAFRIFSASQNGGSRTPLVINLKMDGGYRIVIDALNDDLTGALANSYAITDAPHYVEVYVKRAATDSSADGTVEIWIDGVSKGSATGKDIYNLWYDYTLNVRLGAIYGIDAGTSGTFYLDELIVNDDGGLIGCWMCVLSGSLTPTGALVIQTQKVLAGSLTPTGTLIKQAQKILTGGLTLSGALIKQTQKILTGTLTLSGTLVNQTQKILAGALTLSGSLLKQTEKILTGTLTSSGSLLKQTQKVLAGTLTMSGALLKQTQKVLAGTLTMAGILVNQTQKIMVGTLNMSGVLLKQTQKILVGSLTPTGTLIKQAQKILAGTLTSFGTLVAVFIPPAIAVAANEMFKSMWNGITKRMRGH